MAWEARDAADARFRANLAVFFGTPGPAADLARSLAAFDEAAPAWPEAVEPDERARLLHNRANALAALGSTGEELREAVASYRDALRLRPEATRRVARGVTLHNLGAALRRLAALDESEAALLEAIRLREAEGLPEGLALSTFHLALTREARLDGWGAALSPPGAAAVEATAEAFEDAARRYDGLGRPDEAGVARERAFAILARWRTES